MLNTVLTLRDLRKAKGYTIEEVTMQGGPKMATYAKLDSGAHDIGRADLETFLKICKAFELSPNDMLKQLGIDWKKV